MLIEIHMIQNHSPANLNRDDLGAPKTCIFGGVTRARISSQCLKRSIRNPGNPNDIHNRVPGYFAREMGAFLGRRTKFFPWLVRQALDQEDMKARFVDAGSSEDTFEQEKAAIVAACRTIARREGKEPSAKRKSEKKDDRPQTPQLISLGPEQARRFLDKLLELKKAQPNLYQHFLDPATIFRSLLEDELATASLTDEQRERCLDAAWRIRHTKTRMEQLEKLVVPGGSGEESEAGSGERSDADIARIIGEGLQRVASEDDKLFQSLTSPKKSKGEPDLQTKRKAPKRYEEDFVDPLRRAISTVSVDMALFGRMTTSDFIQDVEAAMQVAHAISTHEVTNEVDYFTAVDDLGKGPGAGHVDEAQFASACFYKYFCLDWDQLVDNLAGPAPAEPKPPSKAKANASDEDKAEFEQDMALHKEAMAAYQEAVKNRPSVLDDARKLAACALGHFLVAALHHLVPIRMAEEGLMASEAVDAVLRDNLHGLEIGRASCRERVFAVV